MRGGVGDGGGVTDGDDRRQLQVRIGGGGTGRPQHSHRQAAGLTRFPELLVQQKTFKGRFGQGEANIELFFGSEISNCGGLLINS
jgi:hypothetical protein